MRKLSTETRAKILNALVEGSSVNSTARMFGVSKVTILRLLSDVGSSCADYHDLHVRALKTRRAECDELWSFCGCKAKTKALGGKGHGDVWTWVAMDSDSKLVISYFVGSRNGEDAKTFMVDVASRLSSRIQLTTDGHRPYIAAVEAGFAHEVDYAMLVKHYEAERPGEARYSPPRCTGCTKSRVVGQPDPEKISTSYIERQNLSVRMGCRRFARLTNAFSKRLANHVAAIALHYFHFNFVRKHMTLKTTPAVAAGIADRPLTMIDLVHMVEREEALLGGRLTDYLPSPAALNSK